MFLETGLWSEIPGRGLFLAAAGLVVGIGVGANIGPVIASRSLADASPEPRAVRGEIRAAHPAEVLRVIDGDTFEAQVDLWPGLVVTTRVRLRGVDAPELKARCDDERVKAEMARETLRTILDQGEVGINHVTLDKYGGRVVADASTQATPDVATALLEAGVARRYGGGRRNGWCD